MLKKKIDIHFDQKEISILYMEDDAVLANFFQKKMERVGFKVDLAKNGELGMLMLKEKEYDIIALDYKMPVYGGLDVLRILSETGEIPPVIMVTGFGDEKIAVEAMKLGASDYIVKDADGGYIELLPAVIKRILKQKYLEEESRQITTALKREQKLFMGGPVTVIKWLACENWPIEYVSSNVIQFGYTVEELISGKTPYSDIVYPEDLEKVTIEVKKLSESGIPSFELEYRIQKGDDSIIWVHTYIVVVKNEDGDITHFDGYLMDITQRKMAEEELRKAKENAEAVTALKEKFVSLVSHDLRSPFISMLGLLKLIRKKEDQYPLHEHTKKILNKVIDNGENMIVFIEKLLNMNQLRSGKIHTKQKFVNIYNLTHLVISKINHLAHEKGINIINDVPKKSVFFVDPDFFAEVIQNLVSNSIKFCKQGDRINVSVCGTDKHTLVVSDTGLGIEQDRQPYVFDYESKTSTLGTNGEKGAGIGLPLCREIMLAHDGTVYIKSSNKSGSVFHVSLPIVRPKVLIVDEKEATCSLHDAIANNDFDLLIADSEKKTKAILQQTLPHLVILNLSIFETKPIEFIKFLKEKGFFSETTIIVSAYKDDVQFQEQAIQAGVKDFLIKPVDHLKAKALIRKYLLIDFP